MNKIIGVTALQRKFRKIFEEVAEDHTPYVLTRGSRPEAALVPYDQYLKYVQLDENGIFKRFDDLLVRMSLVNASFSVKEIERDIQAARKAIRPRKRR